MLLKGKGEEIWSDGAYYKGDYINGEKSGVGLFRWSDGSSYEGEFLGNCMHG